MLSDFFSEWSNKMVTGAYCTKYYKGRDPKSEHATNKQYLVQSDDSQGETWKHTCTCKIF